MASDYLVNIRWNASHSSTIFHTAFTEMLEGRINVDVTLVCDNVRIECHRMILAACSPYFASVLSLNTSPDLVIYLAGVKAWQLDAIVSFMYRGHVEKISSLQLEELCTVARDLQIRGLAYPYDSSQSTCEKLPVAKVDRVSTENGSVCSDTVYSGTESNRRRRRKAEPPKGDTRNGMSGFTLGSECVDKTTDGRSLLTIRAATESVENSKNRELANLATHGSGSLSVDQSEKERQTNYNEKPNVDDCSSKILRSRLRKRPASGDAIVDSSKKTILCQHESTDIVGPSSSSVAEPRDHEKNLSIAETQRNSTDEQLPLPTGLLRPISPSSSVNAMNLNIYQEHSQLVNRIYYAACLIMSGYPIGHAAALCGVSESILQEFMIRSYSNANVSAGSNNNQANSVSTERVEFGRFGHNIHGDDPTDDDASKTYERNGTKNVSDQTTLFMLPK